MAIVLVFFVLLLQFVLWQYGRGAVRSALDEGARAGAATNRPADCQQRAQTSLHQLLGGSMGAQTTITCQRAAGQMIATADATFPAWLGFVPDWTFTLQATVAIEELQP